MNPKAVYIKINKEVGFNRNQLARWRFASEDRVILYFAAGQEELTGADCETFRNWVEAVAEAAPETHQYTLWQRNGGG